MLRTHPDFEFLPYERRSEADVFVGEYGCGPVVELKQRTLFTMQKVITSSKFVMMR